MLTLRYTIYPIIFSLIQDIGFGSIYKPIRCYEQYCLNSKYGWGCKYSRNKVRNCSSNSVCFEGMQSGKEVYRYCQSKFAMNESLFEEIEQAGKYCDNMAAAQHGKLCYCNTSLCNNQFKSPENFQVGEEEYHEAAEHSKTHIKS